MKKISSLVFAITFAAVFFIQIPFAAAGFPDVHADSPYFQDVQYLEQLGAVQEDKFQADVNVTREVFSKWLLKNAGFTADNYEPKTPLRFTDIAPKETAYAPYIYKLLDLGIVSFEKGKPRTFKPKNPITRKEAIAWIFNLEGIPVPKIFDEANWKTTDLTPNSPIAPLVAKAVALNLLPHGKAKPFSRLKRGEAAHMLRLVKSAGPTLTVTILPTMESDLTRNPKFDIMVAAWNRIFQNYLKRGDLNREQVIYGSIEGMVKEIGDKHSSFERPGDNAILESLSGEIEGIGAVLQMKDDEVVVISPIVGSPAEKAGLRTNDVITAVDDVDIKGMSLTAVVSRIKGKKGTQVKLLIRRKTEKLTYTITRDVIKLISASVSWTDDNIAKVVLSSFGENTLGEFIDVEEAIQKKKAKGIVLDLRNNPGGFLNTALSIAGYFVKNGDRVTTVKYADREEYHVSQGNAELASFKIVMLVNEGSASASEILAGALQDYGLAKVIGEKTYGKGTVQELSDFSDGSTLRLTVAEWLTPSGRSIEKNGIAPDIEVKMTDEDRTANRDPQMERALEELRK
ncbi:S-layer homology domain-containing protein [Candidatus Peregrinibacteria bacterium]|nr:S-layer homology domain-containing protein [Candidatus Peregrinibacteria bacterium]